MIKTSLEQVAREAGGELVGEGSAEIESVSISTLCPADLFVAVKGEKTDGAFFIEEAYGKGFKAALTHSLDSSCPLPQILVENSVDALSSLAKANLEKRRQRPGFTEIALTGSVGKTTTKEMIASVLSEKYNTLKTSGNLNNEIGLPFTVCNLSVSLNILQKRYIV